MDELIGLALKNFTVTMLIFGFVATAISLIKHSRVEPLTQALVVEKLFAYFLLFSIGIGYLYNFIIHVFFAEMAAHFIGWANSPFQYEVGFASLGFGVVGVLAFRSSWGFRAAAVIAPAFFSWGAAGGHVYQMLTNHNFAPGNAGTVFWTDILMPTFGLVLLYLQHRTTKTTR